MFLSCFYNSASQREINENTYFGEHGMGYLGRYYKRSTINIKSDATRLFTQFGVLLLGDMLVMPIPILFAARPNYSWPVVAV